MSARPTQTSQSASILFCSSSDEKTVARTNGSLTAERRKIESSSMQYWCACLMYVATRIACRGRSPVDIATLRSWQLDCAATATDPMPMD
eukprot:5928108-Prymnesium_polylepis.1